MDGRHTQPVVQDLGDIHGIRMTLAKEMPYQAPGYDLDLETADTLRRRLRPPFRHIDLHEP